MSTLKLRPNVAQRQEQDAASGMMVATVTETYHDGYGVCDLIRGRTRVRADQDIVRQRPQWFAPSESLEAIVTRAIRARETEARLGWVGVSGPPRPRASLDWVRGSTTVS